MALSKIGEYTGTNSAGSAAVACQEGDVFYAFAFRDGSTTAPSLPSSAGAAGGWVMVPNGTAGASAAAFRVAKLLVAPGVTSVAINQTWTNASSVVIVHMRPSAGKMLKVGGSATQSGSGTTVTYPAVTLEDTSGVSALIAFAGACLRQHQPGDGARHVDQLRHRGRRDRRGGRPHPDRADDELHLDQRVGRWHRRRLAHLCVRGRRGFAPGRFRRRLQSGRLQP